ncbi:MULTISPECIES: LysR substrate-binding domain-containing protein [Achromobacter]|uniref:Transcriptional regulator LrhA n=1 Tax=Alcaligenes xylosoxydans xylosoxydans TaxID=85698 RepID=A0A424WE63_ALCXX|nr:MULTISPECIES: LysR substrate-binding domain-containing protein [Achromobacter]MBC9906117.1 transcriptional regulator LrhA [Achromobacter xylosoxidans]MBD0869913.1 transcriptional regulator LrhA [Achromobacter xylosoxidans]MDH1301218.1 LysR substrate-binding domain-containing protein [Achromobacter sp. GD03932]QNP85108.1 transcriptional regulator LrhA [Achromobacter xylosoxidans]RPJ91533.1 transcriptional regulator LrhA [Achromobacter xylosoxidans]
MRNLDLELLRTLVAIAEHDSFSAAAESLHKTQSAVTQQMLRLESLVDLPLFEKRGRNKRLSSHGEKLVTYARHMLAMNDEALRSLQDSLLEGELRLGSPHDVADSILPSLLIHVVRTFPRIKLEIRVDRSPNLMTALRKGEVDLAVSTRFDQEFEGVVLRTSPTVWLCSADYVHDINAPLPLVLADEPSIFRRIALNALEQSQLRSQTNYVAPNLVAIKAALRARLGITARSVELLGSDMRVLGEKEGLPRLPDVNYYLWIRRDHINPLTRHVYNMLKSNLRLSSNSDEQSG